MPKEERETSHDAPFTPAVHLPLKSMKLYQRTAIAAQW